MSGDDQATDDLNLPSGDRPIVGPGWEAWQDGYEVPRKRFADMDEVERFEAGGGFGFADEVAAALRARLWETTRAAKRGSVGVMTNSLELLWLLDAYEQARGRPIPAAGSSASGTPRTEENRNG